MGEAKQIIFFDEEKKLKLIKEELVNILNQEHVRGLPIAILSVIGGYRTGKSFLLSWLVRYFKADVKNSEWIRKYENEDTLSQFFKWRSGSKPETQGIWAWSEVFVVNGPSGEKVGVLLIDTQGLFDQNNTMKQNANIFTLSTLISSIQIFNLSQKMQEDSLANLQLFSEFGRLALAEKKSSANTMTPFQRIVFLIRDWPSVKEHPFGSQGGKDYIDDYLTINREEGGNDELGERRRQIRQFFSKVDCYLMPKPGEKIETDESDSNSRISDMSENFKNHLGKLPTFLFPNRAVEQPKLVAGTPVLAADVIVHVEYYVQLLNSDEKLSPQSMFQAMAKIHNNVVARDAKKEYKTFVTLVEEKMDYFLTDPEIQLKHLEAERKALDYFSKHQMGDDESNTTILNELNKDITDELESWKKRNEGVKAKIINFNETAMKDAEKMYSTSMNDWLTSTKPFASSKKLAKKDQEMQEKTTNHLKNNLKGPSEFQTHFIIQLQKFVQDFFRSVIVPLNESKEKEETDRLQKIQLEKQREEAQRLAEEEKRKREAAKIEAEREAAQREREHEMEMAAQKKREHEIKKQREEAQRLAEEEKRKRQTAKIEAEREAAQKEREHKMEMERLDREKKAELEKIELKNKAERDKLNAEQAQMEREHNMQLEMMKEKNKAELERIRLEAEKKGFVEELGGATGKVVDVVVDNVVKKPVNFVVDNVVKKPLAFFGSLFD